MLKNNFCLCGRAQLQIEQEELAARRKREEAEAKAKKLQDELALSPDTALAAVRVAGGCVSLSAPPRLARSSSQLHPCWAVLLILSLRALPQQQHATCVAAQQRRRCLIASGERPQCAQVEAVATRKRKARR